MKITWASNAPWLGTGYGTQTKQVVERLLADGHEVAIAANAGLQGKPMVDPGTNALVFPGGADVYSQDVMVPHHNVWTDGDPGWIITLFDVHVFDIERFEDVNVASWVPVDHEPVPPKVADWCRRHPTIAMSKFGQRALADSGIEAAYIPHALDRATWKPTETLPDGRTVREMYGIPEDAFLVMVNAANKGNVPPRKAWGEMFQALGIFMAKHPDAYLYLNTDPHGKFGGIDLIVLQMAVGLDISRVRVPDHNAILSGFVTSEVIAAHYTTADVLLATSMGEGFGLPVIEAQACGTPVIVTDFSAQPELVGAGWAVGFQPYWDFSQASWFATPKVPEIVAALEESYKAKGDTELRDMAIIKASEYDADAVFVEHWRPFLADLERKLDPPTRQQRRANRRKLAVVK